MSESASPGNAGRTNGLYTRLVRRLWRPIITAISKDTGSRVNELRREIKALQVEARKNSEELQHLRAALNATKVDTQSMLDLHYRQVESAVALYSTMDFRVPLATMRNWAISPDFACELARIVEREKPGVVLELGSGSSTVVVATALSHNGSGQVISLDHDADWGRRTSEQLQTSGLEAIGRVFNAPLKPAVVEGEEYPWYDLDSMGTLPRVDMLIVDGPPGVLRKNARYPALPLLREILSPNALIVLDDTKRPDETDIVARWCDLFGAERLDRPETEKGMEILRLAASNPQ